MVFSDFNIKASVVCVQRVSQYRWQNVVVKEAGKPYLGSLYQELTLFREAVESLNVTIVLQMAMYLFITE